MKFIASLLLLTLSAQAFAAGETRFPNGIISAGSASVGTSSAANASAALDIVSTTKGMLPPRMTQTQRDAIATPATGLQIFNTTTNQMNVYNGSSWGAVGGGGGGIFQASQNLLTNNSWETDTSNWTASGGSYARVTAAANIVPPGVGAASWDPSASAQTLTGNSVTITSGDGLSGRNGVLSCAVKTAATDLKMQVYDGTNVITPNTSTNVVPSSSTGFVRYSLNFVFPTSGTVSARFYAQSDSAIAYIDDCYFGLAEGFNVSSASGNLGWQSYTPTFTGFGTASAIEFYWAKQGDSIIIRGRFTSGTSTATMAKVSLPNSLVIDSTKASSSSVRAVGKAINSALTTQLVVLEQGGLSDLTFGKDSSTPTAQQNGDQIASSGNVISFSTTPIPIQGWAAETSYRTNQQLLPTVQKFTSGSGTYTTPAGVSWIEVEMVGGGSGGGGTGSGATAGGTGGDTTFGSSLLSANKASTGGTAGGSSSGAGGTGGTASLGTGPVGVAATGNPGTAGNQSLSSAGGTGGSTPFGGAGAGGSTGQANAANAVANSGSGGGGAPGSGSLFGAGGGGAGGYVKAIITNPSASYSYSVGAGGSAGSAGTGGTAGGAGGSGIIIVTEHYGAESAPLLVGSVTSNSTGLIRSEFGIISSAGTIPSQSGSWISSISHATGTYTYTLASGIFSATPACFCNPSGDSTGKCVVDSNAPTTIRTLLRNSAGTLTDTSHEVFCFGPR